MIFKDSAYVGYTHRTNHKDERERGRWSATWAYQLIAVRCFSFFSSAKDRVKGMNLSVIFCLDCIYSLSLSMTDIKRKGKDVVKKSFSQGSLIV
jgi:hypothetical protein